MRKLKIFFNPGIHPQFAEIYNYPPKGVKYHFSFNRGGGVSHSSRITRMKRKLAVQIHKLGIPRTSRIKNSKKYDLIHSTRGILPITDKPWIVDIESGSAFTGLNWKNLKKPLSQKIIKEFLSQNNCKKIIPQSDYAKKTLLENIDCSGFKHKIETLYLAWHTTKLKRKKSNIVRISFIGRDFYLKGGNDLQEAFKILNKKYKISLKYKGNVPKDKRLNLPNVKYLENIPDPKKFYEEIFGDCDIYVQPTTIDSFGVSILEAMSTGLPIVCTDDFTLPELVHEGYNGFLVKSPVHWYKYGVKDQWDEYKRLAYKNHPKTIKELVEKISILIEDKKLRKRMGRNSFKLVESGKFSIKERNKKLKRIYKEAMK